MTAPTLAQQPAKVRTRDLLERVVWTGVASAATNLGGAVVFGVAVWKAAALTAIAPSVNAVLIIARWRLSVLPDPGAAVAQASYTAALDDVRALPKPAAKKK